jgi:hypothetical protein
MTFLVVVKVLYTWRYRGFAAGVALYLMVICWDCWTGLDGSITILERCKAMNFETSFRMLAPFAS